MKNVFILLLFCSFCVSSFSQVDNYAVVFKGDGDVNFGKVSELNNLSAYTIQFWVFPSVWSKNTSIFQRGSFKASLGESGEIILQAGSQSARIASSAVAAGKWAQLTLIIDNTKLTSYVNGALVGTQTLSTPLKILEEDSEFIIGDKFTGRLDEFRIWNTALDETVYLTQSPNVKGYLLWDNTINKYHPEYDSLLIYYKFDQNLCENIVDYKFRHHGVMKNVTREVVTDNKMFKYRLHSIYTDYSRFVDVPTDAAKYLLTNDLIVMGVTLNDDGSMTLRIPFNKGTLAGGASYLPEYNGRNGVLALDGTGKMNVGKALQSEGSYCFATWMYIDEWVENAYIFKKEKDTNTGVSLRLGQKNTDVILRVNGDEYKYKLDGELVEGKWIHISFSTNRDYGTNSRDNFVFECNSRKNKSTPYLYPLQLKSWKLDQKQLSAVETSLGENFKGKLDETMIWNGGKDFAGLASMGTEGPNMPAIGKVVGIPYAQQVDSYWTYDLPNDPGYDFFSYKYYNSLMREAYNGYRGYRIRLSVSGGPNWGTAIADVKKREKFTTELADFLNNSDDLDGVDFDLEYVYDHLWSDYGKLMTLMRGKLRADKLLTLTPHTVTYKYPVKDMWAVDYFLFQNYGPSKDNYTYNRQRQAHNFFLSWGYPKEKIVMSYATQTSQKYNSSGGNAGPVVRIYQIGDFGPDDDEHNGYYFAGFNQSRWRTEQVKELEMGGIMCWSLFCDFPDTNNPLSQIRAANFAIASNVDTLITKVDMTPVGIKSVDTNKNNEFTILSDPASGKITWIMPNGLLGDRIKIYNTSGVCIINKRTSENYLAVENLSKGHYYATLYTKKGEILKSKFLKL